MMREDLWSSVDFDSTIKDYEFTRKTINEIHRVVYSADFEDMDADTIFAYLKGKMQMVSFRDYLRRYLYGKMKIDEPFYKVSDSVYQEIIMNSFDETYTPYSFEPTSTRWKNTVKLWLSSENVKRSAIFLMGFGLRMSRADVSEFLTKVIKEDDINPVSPTEVIYGYCYQHSLPYSFASEKLKWYENLPGSSEETEITDDADFSEGFSVAEAEMSEEASKALLFENEDELDQYLINLKKQNRRDQELVPYQVFDSLVERAKETVAEIYREDEELSQKQEWTTSDITSADIEKIICCGIPRTRSGNLEKMSASLLNKHFRQKRISRQRLDNLQLRKIHVDRFDLITLLFFVYSQETPDEEPEIRCMRYIDEINRILGECHMSALYPVNAYEAFILMCLLSDDPLPTYSEIWEMSYQGE